MGVTKQRVISSSSDKHSLHCFHSVTTTWELAIIFFVFYMPVFLTNVCCLLRSLETGLEQSPLRLDGAERTYVCAFLLLTTVTRKTYRRMRSHILRDHGLQSLNLIHSLHTHDITLHYTVTYEMYHKISCDNRHDCQ